MTRRYQFHYVLHPGEHEGRFFTREDLIRLYGLEDEAARCFTFGPDTRDFRGMVHLYPDPHPLTPAGMRDALEKSLLKGAQKKRLLRAGIIIDTEPHEARENIRNES